MERLERRLARSEPTRRSDEALRSPTQTSDQDQTPATDSNGDASPDIAVDEARAVAPAGSPSPDVEVSLEQLKAIWPGLFGSLREVLGARRWAFFREAVPAAVDGNAIVLEVAHDFHLQSLQEDDDVANIVGARASELLKAPVQVRFALRDGGLDDGDTDIDITQLEERPAEKMDPMSLLSSELGAEVVEE